MPSKDPKEMIGSAQNFAAYWHKVAALKEIEEPWRAYALRQAKKWEEFARNIEKDLKLIAESFEYLEKLSDKPEFRWSREGSEPGTSSPDPR